MTNKEKADELRDYVCKNRLPKRVRKQIYARIRELDPPPPTPFEILCRRMVEACLPNLVHNDVEIISPKYSYLKNK